MDHSPIKNSGSRAPGLSSEKRRVRSEEEMVALLLERLSGKGSAAEAKLAHGLLKQLTSRGAKQKAPASPAVLLERLQGLVAKEGAGSGIFCAGDVLYMHLFETLDALEVGIRGMKRGQVHTKLQALARVKSVRLRCIALFASLSELRNKDLDPSRRRLLLRSIGLGTGRINRMLSSLPENLAARSDATALAELLNDCVGSDPHLLFRRLGDNAHGLDHVTLIRRYLRCLQSLNGQRYWQDAKGRDAGALAFIKQAGVASRDVKRALQRLDAMAERLETYGGQDAEFKLYAEEALRSGGAVSVEKDQEALESLAASLTGSHDHAEARNIKALWIAFDHQLFETVNRAKSYLSDVISLRSVELSELHAEDLQQLYAIVQSGQSHAARALTDIPREGKASGLHEASDLMQRLLVSTKLKHQALQSPSVAQKLELLQPLMSCLSAAWSFVAKYQGTERDEHSEEADEAQVRQWFLEVHAQRLLDYVLSAVHAMLVQRKPANPVKKSQETAPTEWPSGRGRRGSKGGGRRAQRSRPGRRKARLARNTAKTSRGKKRAKPSAAPSVRFEPSTLEIPALPERERCDPIQTEPLTLDQDFLESLDVRGGAKQYHGEVYKEHGRRLHTLSLAVRELKCVPKAAHRGVEWARALSKLDYAQRLLESSAMRTLSMLKWEGSTHILERFPRGSHHPLKEQHSLRLLFAPLSRVDQFTGVIARYAGLIRLLDASHTYLSYSDRCLLDDPRRHDEGVRNLVSLIQRPASAEESQALEAGASNLLDESILCCCELLALADGMDTATLSITLTKEAGQFQSAQKEESAASPPSSKREVRAAPLSNPCNTIPASKGFADQQERVNQCCSLLAFIRQTPAFPGHEAKERARLRDATLAHVHRFLLRLNAVYAGVNRGKPVWPEMISAVDLAHRAVKETIVAALYHHPFYGPTSHRVHEPTSKRREGPLLFDNNVCATFQALSLALAGHKKCMGQVDYLPADFGSTLSYLSGIHDRIDYPTRKRPKGGSEHPVYLALERVRMNAKRLRELDGVERGFKIVEGARSYDGEQVMRWLQDDQRLLFEEGVGPALDALYLILRGAFTVAGPEVL